MEATQHDKTEETQRTHAIALGMICAAIGYSCSLTTTIYPPEHYTLFALACILAPAAYIAFRFAAHRGKALDPHPLLRHCAIAMAIALLPMLFAIDSLNDALKIILNAAPLACSGIAILGILSLKNPPAQAFVIMAACGLGWVIGSRGALYGGLNSLALHSTTALVIATLIASVALFPSLKTSSTAHEEREAIPSPKKPRVKKNSHRAKRFLCPARIDRSGRDRGRGRSGFAADRRNRHRMHRPYVRSLESRTRFGGAYRARCRQQANCPRAVHFAEYCENPPAQHLQQAWRTFKRGDHRPRARQSIKQCRPWFKTKDGIDSTERKGANTPDR